MDGDMTELRQAAVTAHEAFSEFVAAGFDEKQALYLTGLIITGGSAQ